MENLGIEKLKLIADGINDAVDVGEKVLADGKVTTADIFYTPDAARALTKIYSGVKDLRSVVAEGKDIDPAEAVELVQILLAKK